MLAVIGKDVVEQIDLPRELISNHFDINRFAHTKPDRANEILINPRFKLTHPMIHQVSNCCVRVKGKLKKRSVQG